MRAEIFNLERRLLESEVASYRDAEEGLSQLITGGILNVYLMEEMEKLELKRDGIMEMKAKLVSKSAPV